MKLSERYKIALVTITPSIGRQIMPKFTFLEISDLSYYSLFLSENGKDNSITFVDLMLIKREAFKSGNRRTIEESDILMLELSILQASKTE